MDGDGTRRGAGAHRDRGGRARGARPAHGRRHRRRGRGRRPPGRLFVVRRGAGPDPADQRHRARRDPRRAGPGAARADAGLRARRRTGPVAGWRQRHEPGDRRGRGVAGAARRRGPGIDDHGPAGPGRRFGRRLRRRDRHPLAAAAGGPCSPPPPRSSSPWAWATRSAGRPSATISRRARPRWPSSATPRRPRCGSRRSRTPSESRSTATAAGGEATGTLTFSGSSGELVALAAGLEPEASNEEYGCWVEVDGERRRLGKMYWAGDVWTWAGPVEGLGDLPSDAVFGVSLSSGEGNPSEPVLTGGL